MSTPQTPMMAFKVATLNLCLGLSNKKETVKQMIIEEKIDILYLQETNIDEGLDHDLMSFPGFK